MREARARVEGEGARGCFFRRLLGGCWFPGRGVGAVGFDGERIWVSGPVVGGGWADCWVSDAGLDGSLAVLLDAVAAAERISASFESMYADLRC